MVNKKKPNFRFNFNKKENLRFDNLKGFHLSENIFTTNRGKRLISAEINVTPLIDVMLVLLIVFMVTAPMMTGSIYLNLPQAESSTNFTEYNYPIDIAVSADGKYYINDELIEKDKIINRILELTKENKNYSIRVKGDKSSNYGDIVKIIGKINEQGYSKISLVVKK